MKQIENILNGLIYETKMEPNSRALSWEHCYKEFNKAHKECNKLSEERLDYLSLHLAFYLASWGMYRGSSFLLQKDYKVHKDIIKLLFQEKYNQLWSIPVNNYNEDNIKLLFELITNMKKIYYNIRQDVKDKEIKNTISDTLITKVLMGTMGCLPAYDRYFITGIKNNNIVGTLSKKSIKDLIDFYNKNYEILEKKRKELKTSNIEYPQMKIIDMYFWQLGFNIENN